MNKRKVLIVIHQLNHGGVQKALLSVLDALDYEKNEVTLYVRKNRLQLLPEVNKQVNRVIINEDNTHYYRKPYSALLLFLMLVCDLMHIKGVSEKIQKRLTEYINESQMKYEYHHYFKNQNAFDVAVSYIQGYTAKFVADYVQANKKVMFFHGSTDENHELHEELLHKMNAVVGVNNNVKEILCELYPMHSAKMTYIRNYVNAEEVRYKSQAYEVQKEDKRIILCSCGRLTPVKGFNLAVDAAKIMKEKGILFKWYFVGDGPERAKLEHQIEEYGLSAYIEITGMQDNPYPYISDCDIYVQPSYEESHSLTIEEALILNRPVVSTETVGGKMQIVQEYNGFVCDFNGESISYYVEMLIRNPEMRKRIMEQLERIDYSENLREYKDSWEKLLED